MRLTVRITWSASPDRRLPRLAPPLARSPRPVEWVRSISAQSPGPEHATSFADSFTTQRKAGMFSFEPSRIPAWLAPVCDERSVSHSASSWLPSSSQRAMCGAFPSRIARCSTGRARPSISRKMIPGASVLVSSPERRAIRRMTRYVYVSSSFVPKSTSSTTPTADATSATPRADQNESIERSPSVSRSAARSISASSTRTSSRPRTSINGRRSAATIGGNRALRTAITATATNALQKLFTCAPGTIQAAARSAAADRIQARINAAGRNFGRAGCQTGSAGTGD